MLDILRGTDAVAIQIFVVSNMLAIGLGHTIGQIVTSLRSPRLVFWTLCLNLVILPLIAFALAIGLGLEEALGDGLILLGLASGAPFVPKLTELAHGNLQFAVAAMGLLTVGTITFMPLALPMLVPGVAISFLTVTRPLLLFVLLPLTLGLIAKAFFDDAATRLGPIFDGISNGSVLPVVILVVALHADNALDLFGTGGILAGFLLLFLGLVVGWLLGGPGHGTRRALALSTGVRNFAVAMVVASEGFDDPKVEIMVIVTAIIALTVATPLSLLWG